MREKEPMNTRRPEEVTISQSVAILIDGNNIERSIHDEVKDPHTMLKEGGRTGAGGAGTAVAAPRTRPPNTGPKATPPAKAATLNATL